jgi:outer membrane protein OmpA-like peptidoglycan-associated protein
MERRQTYPLLSLAVIGALAVAGCAAGPNADIARARHSLMAAAQDPQVATYAPEKLQDAQQTLNEAEHVWQNETDRAEAAHLSYVAEQQARIAVATAQKHAAEAEAQRLAEERDQVRVTAREREATAAQLRAQEATTRAQEATARAQEATARAHALEQELAALNAKNTDRGLVMTLDSALFDYNSATLKPGAMNKLYPLVTFLREHPERNVLIEGYTDSTGSEAYNMELSQRRAQAVQDFLLRNGVPPAQLSARGYGENFPVASNDTEAGRLQNRRVDIIVSHGSERVAGR